MSYCLTVTAIWSRSADFVLGYIRSPKVINKLVHENEEEDEEDEEEPNEEPDVSKETQLIGTHVLRWWRRQSAAIVIQRAASRRLVNRLTHLQNLVRTRGF